MSFTVYKSSAGSGKTYNLVKEYLKIVLANPADFRKILAITFTNKAAEEMKNRIAETLSQIIDIDVLESKNKEKITALINDFKIVLAVDEALIKKNAQRAFELILHNYSDFAVSTIDSFVYGIVKTFAKDLYIPLNFDVELETDTLLNQAIDILISRVGSDADLTRMLVKFIETQVDDQRSLNIELEIKKTCKYLFQEESIINISKLNELQINDFFDLQSKLFSLISGLESKLKSIAMQGCQLIERSNISPQAFYYKEKGMYSYFENAAALKTESIGNKNVAKGVESDKWTSDSATSEEINAINNIKSELAKYYYEIQDFAKNELKSLNLYHLMYRNVFTLAVLGEVASIIEDIKRENNILHISEFNKKIASIVLNEPIPFIYERTGERYKHFMIDEFQDTSVLQWLNLLPLLENALAEGGFTMVVGDGKQAIYRWRDGDVEQFIKLPALSSAHEGLDLTSKEQALINNYIEIELKRNYRSFKQIIDFNNDFFENVSKQLPEKYTEIYKQVAQQSDEKKMGGYVQIDFIEKNDEQTLEALNLDKVLSIVDDLILNKGYAASDIAILCRSNKNANAIARFLIQNNIEVLSSESLLLNKSPLINFIITLLEFIYSKENKIAAVNIVNYLIKHDDSGEDNLTEMFHLIADDDNYLLNELSKRFAGFDYFRLKNMGLYDMCEEIIRIFKLNLKSDAYLQFFLDVVFTYSVTKKNNISDFLTWWDEKSEKFSVIVPQGINAVKVMTIHKAKGLQFPVVIYPFANEKVKLNKKNLWIDIDDINIPNINTYLIPATSKAIKNTSYSYLYEEEDSKSRLDLMNILYVVLTRPVEKLFILSEIPGEKLEAMSVNGLLKTYLKTKGLWNDQLLHYEFGLYTSNPKPVAEINKADNRLIFDIFISTRWQDKLVMKYKAKDIWNLETNEASLKWGNLIHNVMCNIISETDIDTTIDRLQQDGFLENDEKDLIKNKINNFINHPSLKDFYTIGCTVKNEQDILDSNGQTYRPDRIAFTSQKTAVIDYKTGAQEAKHKTQVDKYAELLKEMGYNNIEKYLVYIDKDLVVGW